MLKAKLYEECLKLRSRDNIYARGLRLRFKDKDQSQVNYDI
jgi:hypothetical protein